jgi:hypothetical protein
MIFVGEGGGTRPDFSRLEPLRCCACGWPQCTGIISFGNKMHEPHCDACCKDWQNILKLLADHGSFPLTLKHFRFWQSRRGGTA